MNSDLSPSRAANILPILKHQFPTLEIPLHHRNAFELLIATILSAQTTDVRVNSVTPRLFEKFKDAASLAVADLEEVKQIIAPIGMANTKAKHITAAAQLLIADFAGEVPQTLAELTRLPGVGRKVATVVLYQAFGINQGFTVDTHVLRLAQKFGLTRHTDPFKVERDLMQLFPQSEWGDTSLRLILHGRICCKARGARPQADCVLGAFWAKAL